MQSTTLRSSESGDGCFSSRTSFRRSVVVGSGIVVACGESSRAFYGDWQGVFSAMGPLGDIDEVVDEVVELSDWPSITRPQTFPFSWSNVNAG